MLSDANNSTNRKEGDQATQSQALRTPTGWTRVSAIIPRASTVIPRVSAVARNTNKIQNRLLNRACRQKTDSCTLGQPAPLKPEAVETRGHTHRTSIIHTPGLRHALFEEIGGRHAQVLRLLQVAKGCFVAAYIIKYNKSNGGLHNQRLSHWCMHVHTHRSKQRSWQQCSGRPRMKNAAGKAKTPHDFLAIPISAGGRKKAPFGVRG